MEEILPSVTWRRHLGFERGQFELKRRGERRLTRRGGRKSAGVKLE